MSARDDEWAVFAQLPLLAAVANRILKAAHVSKADAAILRVCTTLVMCFLGMMETLAGVTDKDSGIR
jgi:hypothetical protein